MKKIISVICILSVALCFFLVPAAAVEASQTILDVQSGDEVTYQLVLSDVAEPVVGCDFSVYYDSDVFDVVSVADFSNSTNEDDWRAIINPNIEGEVLGNWSILKGVDFSKGGNIVTVNFKAKASSSTHLSYYVRYMYPDSLEEFTQYTFTCNVTKNGSTVLENAKPELNVHPSGDHGKFVNSLDGDSANAGQDIEINSPQNGAEPNEGSASGSNNAGSSNGTSSAAQNSATAAPKYETVISTDADGNQVISVIEATPDQTKDGASPALWIIIGVIAVVAVCAIVYFVVKRKKNPADVAVKTDSDQNTSDQNTTDQNTTDQNKSDQ